MYPMLCFCQARLPDGVLMVEVLHHYFMLLLCQFCSLCYKTVFSTSSGSLECTPKTQHHHFSSFLRNASTHGCVVYTADVMIFVTFLSSLL